MEDYEFVNSIVDEVISRITDNVTELGNLNAVTEKDEDPAIIENPNECFVIPIGDGDMAIQNIQGGGYNYIEFPINIVGIYKYYGNNAIEQGLRPVRNYGLMCNALFSGDNVVIVPNAARISSVMKSGYWTSTDYVMHYFYLTITVKGINS